MDIQSTVNAVSDLQNSVNNVGAVIQRATAKTSITRLTKDQIFQFPIAIESDIDDDEKYPIIKAIEKNYASLILTAIVNEGVINRDKYDNISQFLRKFHNNTDIPFSAVESEINVVSAIAEEGYIPSNELLQMDVTIEALVDTSSLNDMYLPFNRTLAKVNTALESAKTSIAMEASEYFRRPRYDRDRNGQIIGGANNPQISTNNQGKIQYQYIEAPQKGTAQYNNLVSLYGEPKTLNEWDDVINKQDVIQYNEIRREEREIRAAERREDRRNRVADRQEDQKIRAAERAEDRRNRLLDRQEDRYQQLQDKSVEDARRAMSNVRGEMLRDEKYGSLMPTVLNMTIANVKSQAGSWSQQLTIGIRAVPRYFSSSIMIANMCEAFKNGLVFTFLKFTKGELKWWDSLLGITDARNNAIINRSDRWLRVLKSLSKKNKRKINNKHNPNMTIIITENDAILIKEKCGIDPHSVSAVKKMMDKYFILGFGIYDTEAKMLNMIYDGDADFSQYSLRSMIADSKKELNLLAMNRY